MIRFTNRAGWVAVQVLFAAVMAGCGGPAPQVADSGGEGAPKVADNSSDWANPGGVASQARGSATPEGALFVEKCSMCHREMGMGTVILARRLPAEKAILEARDDLTAEYIKVVVRTGVGNMPRLGRGEVSDEQLEVITRHLLKKEST
jgi:hypothetical protein